jgi:hypothetical protein
LKVVEKKLVNMKEIMGLLSHSGLCKIFYIFFKPNHRTCGLN